MAVGKFYFIYGITMNILSANWSIVQDIWPNTTITHLSCNLYSCIMYIIPHAMYVQYYYKLPQIG